MGCRGHFGPQAEFSGWNTGYIINQCRCYNTSTNGVTAQKLIPRVKRGVGGGGVARGRDNNIRS